MRIARLGLALATLVCSSSILAEARIPDTQVTVSGSAVNASTKQFRAKYGADCVWNGSTGLWSTVANWSCGEVPDIGSTAIIDSGHVILDESVAIGGELRLTGGVLEVNTPRSFQGQRLSQSGGVLRITETGSLHFNRGDRYDQGSGELELRFASLSQFGRLNFDNGIGGLGLYGLAGTLRLVGVNGYTPTTSDQFEIVRGSSLSTVTSGYIPTVVHQSFPVNFRPFLGTFSGVVRDAYPGACVWDGSDGRWNNRFSWSCGRVPTMGDRAVVFDGDPNVTEDANVGSLVVEGGTFSFTPGVTLMTFGDAGSNSLSGRITFRSRGRVILGGETNIVSGAYIEAESDIENRGTLRLQMRASDAGAGGFNIVNDSPPQRVSFLNTGVIEWNTRGVIRFAADLDFLNQGMFTFSSSDASSPGTIRFTSGAAYRQEFGHTIWAQNAYIESEAPVVLVGGQAYLNGQMRIDLHNTGGVLHVGPLCPSGGEAAAMAKVLRKDAICSGTGRLYVASYAQGSNAYLDMQVQGSNASQFDQLEASGTAVLGGGFMVRSNGVIPTSDLVLVNAPSVSGTFASVGNDFAPAFEVAYLPSAVVLRSGAAPPPDTPPAFTGPLAPANGKVGVPYTHDFSASGFPLPTFAVSSGKLPTGLALTPQGGLAGEPSRPGNFTATVTASNGVPPDATQTFSITIVPGDPASVAASSGSGQAAAIGSAFAVPLAAVVRDVGNNPLANVQVTFAAPPAGATASFAQAVATTNASGIASTTARAIGAPGSYSVTASVQDVAGSAIFSLTNLAAPDTQNPTAVLQAPSSASIGTSVSLSGSNSFDTGGGHIVQYRWSAVQRPAGATAFATPATTPTPSFAFTPDRLGTWIVRLVVTDDSGNESSATDKSISVVGDTQNPTAVLQAPSSVLIGTQVSLSGTSSFDTGGGHIVRYDWSAVQRPAGATAFATRVSTEDPAFRFTPDRLGTWIVRLVVIDDFGNVSSPHDQSISVVGDTQNPTAVLQAPASVLIGTQVSLSGTSSFDTGGGHIVEYMWSAVQRPAGATAFATRVSTEDPSFRFTPDRLGTWIVRLVVIDDFGNVSSATDKSINVTGDTQNPTAVLQAPASVLIGTQVSLSGASSFDTGGGHIVRYDWSAVQRPAGATAFATRVSTEDPSFRFTPDRLGTWIVRLVVSDDSGNVSSATDKSISVVGDTQNPTAVLQAASTALVGTSVPLSGSSSFDTGGGHIVEYRWTAVQRPAGATAFPTPVSTQTPSFAFTPDRPGTWVVRLEVTDDFGNTSEPALATIVVDTPTRDLTVKRLGDGTGLVASNPAGISCGATCSANFPLGSSVDLVPDASGGSAFTGWGGACSGKDKCSVKMDAAREVTATFLAPRTLTVNKAGTGTGFVVSTPAGISCDSKCKDASAQFAAGSVVQLNVDTGQGTAFEGWSGACSGKGICTVTMDAAKSVTATFTDTRKTLTVAKEGDGSGFVLSNPAGISCGQDCTEDFLPGTSVSLTVDAAGTSVFEGWSGACTGKGACVVKMDAAASVTARFALPRPKLTVTRAGDGAGTVTSTPAGIACGAQCSATFTTGAQVQLEALANAGSRFAGWSGACTGATTCVVAMSADAAVTARFDLDRIAPRITSGLPPAGTAGVPYRHVFAAIGSTPIAFTIASGALPPGLALSSDGVLAGTPVVTGSFALRVRAANGAKPDAEQPFTLVLAPGAAARLVIASGNHQVAPFDRRIVRTSAFELALAVKLVGTAGNGIPGRTVEFTPMAPANSAGESATATLSALTATTDANGLAQVAATTASNIGSYQVRARVDGFEPVYFDLTNIANDLGRPFRLRAVSPDPSGRELRQSTPIHAPFPEPLKVTATDSGGRFGVPGLEVRFFAPLPPGSGDRASAVLEGGAAGHLTPQETTRSDGSYLDYRSVVTDSDGTAEIPAFANGAAGSYDVKAVLVEDGGVNDPLAAPSGRVASLGLDNLADAVELRPSRAASGQKADAGMRFAEPISVQALRGRDAVAGIELWFFAGDDAAGEPGAHLVAEGLAEGRLPDGRRYAAVVTSSGGIASVTAVANAFKGTHRVIVAYPGDFATLDAAPLKTEFTLENTSGVKADGVSRKAPEGARIEIASGNFQVGRGDNKPFAHPLAVRATDSRGAPLAGVNVRFVPQSRADSRNNIATVVASESLAVTDRLGLARTSVQGEGDGTVHVIATLMGTESAVDFTLTLDARFEPGTVRLEGVPVGARGADDANVGGGQSQIVLARFDEPLVAIAIGASRTPPAGLEVRFFVPDAIVEEKGRPTFEPEDATLHTWSRKDGTTLRYYRLITGSAGGVSLRGLANPQAGSYDVVAMLADPGEADANDPSDAPANRIVTFRLTNVVAGAAIERIAGHEQAQVTRQRFVTPLRVRVAPSKAWPVRRLPSGQPGSPFLDGAEIWFMTPVPRDDKTPGAVLVGGEDSRLAASGNGTAWRVTAAPVDEDGFAQVTAIANAVTGTHRVFAAYPGAFDDPAKAPGHVEFLLCNTDQARARCVDVTEEPATIVPVEPIVLTYEERNFESSVLVRDLHGRPVVGVPVTFMVLGRFNIEDRTRWTQVEGSIFFRTVVPTDASGVARSGNGLSLTAGTQGEISASVPGITQPASIIVSSYIAARQFGYAGIAVSAAAVGTSHARLSVLVDPVPIRWTIVPGATGAGGTFEDGSMVKEDIVPPARAGNAGARVSGVTVRANGIRGIFTLRAEIIGSPQTPAVIFRLTNLAAPPASIQPVRNPAIAYGERNWDVQVVVRDANGKGIADVPVTFTALGRFSIEDRAHWAQTEGSIFFARVVVTNSSGIASSGGGLALQIGQTAPVSAAALGLATPVEFNVSTYEPASEFGATGPKASATFIGTQHAPLAVRSFPAVPMRWTIVPGASGAGGTFEGGALVREDIEPPRPIGQSIPQTRSVRVVANGIPGRFKLRAEAIDTTAVAPVEFELDNLASPSATLVPIDETVIAYERGFEMQARVRDANGRPVENVQVTFTVLGRFVIEDRASWTQPAGSIFFARVVATGKDGIARSGPGLSLRIGDTADISAAAHGVTEPATIHVSSYREPESLAIAGNVASVATVNGTHTPLAVRTTTTVPIRWTIVPGPNGAGGTFANGALVMEDIVFPRPVGSDGGRTASQVVTANGIVGSFTVKAEVIGVSRIPAVVFALTNRAR